MISSAPGTADTPRAHITNPGTIECFRDMGIEEELLKQANTGDCLTHMRWCRSLAGEEYARVHAFGYGPENMVISSALVSSLETSANAYGVGPF